MACINQSALWDQVLAGACAVVGPATCSCSGSTHQRMFSLEWLRPRLIALLTPYTCAKRGRENTPGNAQLDKPAATAEADQACIQARRCDVANIRWSSVCPNKPHLRVDQKQHQHGIEQLTDKCGDSVGALLVALGPVLLKCHQHLEGVVQDAEPSKAFYLQVQISLAPHKAEHQQKGTRQRRPRPSPAP
jgi:hypothetical protein